MSVCGSWSAYTRGCRCDECREAARRYMRNRRESARTHRLPDLVDELAVYLVTYMRVEGVLRRYVRVDGRWLRDDRLGTEGMPSIRGTRAQSGEPVRGGPPAHRVATRSALDWLGTAGDDARSEGIPAAGTA